MPRGRPKEIPQQEAPRKFTRTYEDETTVETWTFNLDKFDKGPVSVDIKYKNGVDKRWVKEQNEQKRVKKEMKRIAKVKPTKSAPKKRKTRKK